MRTEEDLRVALAAREDFAPDPESVLAGARRVAARRRRRNGSAVASAVVTVLLLAAAAPVVARVLPAHRSGPAGGPGQAGSQASGPSGSLASGPSATDRQVASDPRPPFSFTVSPVAVGAFEIQPEAVTPDMQLAAIRRSGRAPILATLFVYRPGSNVIAGWDAGSPVPAMVNGAGAWYSEGNGKSALRWTQTPGGWAVIDNPSTAVLSRSDLIRLAEAVRFTEAYPAKVPYRPSYLPAGFTPFNVAQDTSVPGARRSVVQFQAAGGVAAGLDISVLDGPPSNVDRATGDFAARPDPNWRPNTTLTGRPAYCATLVDGSRCAVDFGTFTVSVGFAGVPRTEVERIVAGIAMADWSDTGTWYDVDAVLPIH